MCISSVSKINWIDRNTKTVLSRLSKYHLRRSQCSKSQQLYLPKQGLHFNHCFELNILHVLCKAQFNHCPVHPGVAFSLQSSYQMSANSVLKFRMHTLIHRVKLLCPTLHHSLIVWCFFFTFNTKLSIDEDPVSYVGRL